MSALNAATAVALLGIGVLLTGLKVLVVAAVVVVAGLNRSSGGAHH